MKTKLNLLLIVVFTLTATVGFGQSKIVTANIKVYGNCTMCKTRIETALDHRGIKQAVWSPKTKNLEVVYNSAKITEQEIHDIVASVGHDTDKVKAKDDVYAALPFCCLYRTGESEGHK